MATPIQINIPDSDDQTAAQVPITPIASSTQVAIAGPSAQDALEQLAAAVKAVETAAVPGTTPRPWAKSGDAQATNGEAVLVTDNIYHVGKINEGIGFEDMAANVNYVAQTEGNRRVTGLMRASSMYWESSAAFLTVDPVNGVDGADPAVAGVPAFRTLSAALLHASLLAAPRIFVAVRNTTLAAPALHNTNVGITSKFVFIYSFDFSTTQFLLFSANLFTYNTTLSMRNLDLRFSAGNVGFVLPNSQFQVTRCDLYLNASRLNGTISLEGGGKFNANNIFNLYFTANNQGAFQMNDGWGGTEVCLNGPACVVSSGSFTGCTLHRSNSPLISAVVKLDCGAVISPNINLLNANLYVGGNLVQKQAGYQPFFTQHAIIAGGPQPVRLTDMLTAPATLAAGTKMVVADGNGTLGWQDLPTSGGSATVVFDPVDVQAKTIPDGVVAPSASFGYVSYPSGNPTEVVSVPFVVFQTRTYTVQLWYYSQNSTNILVSVGHNAPINVAVVANAPHTGSLPPAVVSFSLAVPAGLQTLRLRIAASGQGQVHFDRIRLI